MGITIGAVHLYLGRVTRAQRWEIPVVTSVTFSTNLTNFLKNLFFLNLKISLEPKNAIEEISLLPELSSPPPFQNPGKVS